MPAYEFRCPQCDTVFEVTRPFSRASEPATCPKDGTLAVRHFVSGAVLRGGFRGRREMRVDPHADEGKTPHDG